MIEFLRIIACAAERRLPGRGQPLRYGTVPTACQLEWPGTITSLAHLLLRRGGAQTEMG